MVHFEEVGIRSLSQGVRIRRMPIERLAFFFCCDKVIVTFHRNVLRKYITKLKKNASKNVIFR